MHFREVLCTNDFAGNRAVFRQGRLQRADHDQARIIQQLGDLRGPADILRSVECAEGEVLVQAQPQVFAVENRRDPA